MRANRYIYGLGAIIGVLGTIGLLFTDATSDVSFIRIGGAGLSVLWVAAWIALLRRDAEARRNEEAMKLLHSLTEARRLLLADDNPRQVLVNTALDVASGTAALLAEVRGDSLVARAAAGADLTKLVLPLSGPSLSRTVLDSRQPLTIRNIHHEPGAARATIATLESALGAAIQAVAFVPIVSSRAALGILVVVYESDDAGMAERAVPNLELLSGEAALAIERDQHLAALHALAETDPLTSVSNVRAWQRSLATMSRLGGIAVLDMDHFKDLNDSEGHAAGDTVLRAFGTHLRSVARDEDTVARIGGEEFAILVHRAEDLPVLVERLRGSWARLPSGRVTFSCGIAFRTRGDTPASVQQRADEALYKAKRDGRDRTVLNTGEADPSTAPVS